MYNFSFLQCFVSPLSWAKHDLKVSLLTFRPYVEEACDRFTGGRRKPKGFSYTYCPQSVWLLGTSLGSGRAACRPLAGLSSTVLQMEGSFPPLQVLDIGGQRQLWRWDEVLAVFLSRAEKATTMLSWERILMLLVLKPFPIPFLWFSLRYFTIIWISSLQNYVSEVVFSLS